MNIEHAGFRVTIFTRDMREDDYVFHKFADIDYAYMNSRNFELIDKLVFDALRRSYSRDSIQEDHFFSIALKTLDLWLEQNESFDVEVLSCSGGGKYEVDEDSPTCGKFTTLFLLRIKS